MRTSSKKSDDVIEARRDSLFSISCAAKPRAPFSTRNARMPSSVSAQTSATCAIEPFVIQIFAPFNIQSPPSRRARVRITDGSEPP